MRTRTIEASIRKIGEVVARGGDPERMRILRWRRGRLEERLRSRAIVDAAYPGRSRRREGGG